MANTKTRWKGQTSMKGGDSQVRALRGEGCLYPSTLRGSKWLYFVYIAFGRETSVASHFGCCARRPTRLRKTEMTGSLMLTESDEPTPRQYQNDGGGTNVVYENKVVHTALANRVTCIVAFWVSCEDVSYYYVAAKKQENKKLQTSKCMHVCARYAHRAI